MKKKVLISVAAVALVLCVAIGGTLAWLTDKTQEVKNTFTVGDVDIAMSETVNNADKNTDNDGNIENDGYKMIPGATLAKDPKVIVNSSSEACWLFVEITESTNAKFSDYMEYTVATGWTELQNGVYYRSVDAVTADNGASYGVLKDDQVTVKNTVTKTMLDALTEATYPTLTFKAYAIQSENLTDGDGNAVTDAAKAWAIVSAAN